MDSDRRAEHRLWTRHTATLLSNGKVLAVAGRLASASDRNDNTNSAELYNPATGTWTTTGSLTTGPRHSQTATLLPNGQVLIAAGYNFTATTTLLARNCMIQPPGSGQPPVI